MIPAIAYVRISMDDIKEGDPDGRKAVRRQREDADKRALDRGFTLIATQEDNDLSAGGTKHRPGFKRVMSAINAGTVKVVICDRLDRIARNATDRAAFLTAAKEHSLLISLTKGAELDASTAIGRQMIDMMLGYAQFELELMQERMERFFVQHAKEGKPWWPVRPFGLMKDGALHETEAPALAAVYASVIKGASLASQARWLNDQGFRTAKGNEWTGVTLRPVLTSPRNAAIRVYKGTEVGPASWSAVVDERTYRAVVRVLDDDSRKSGATGRRQGLLSGAMVCWHCGGPSRLHKRYGAGGKTYQVYLCGLKFCATVPRRDAEVFVLANAVILLKSPLAQEMWRTASDGSAESAFDTVKDIETQMSEWQEDRTAGRVTRAQFLNANADLMQRLTKAREQLEVVSPAMPSMPSPEYVREYLLAMPADQQRVIFRTMFTIRMKSAGKGRKDVPIEDRVVVTLGEGDTEIRHADL